MIDKNEPPKWYVIQTDESKMKRPRKKITHNGLVPQHPARDITHEDMEKDGNNLWDLMAQLRNEQCASQGVNKVISTSDRTELHIH